MYVRLNWQNQLRAALRMPKLVCSLCSRMSWSTVLNAADRSNRTSAAKSPRSTAARMSDRTHSRAVSVEPQTTETRTGREKQQHWLGSLPSFCCSFATCSSIKYLPSLSNEMFFVANGQLVYAILVYL